MKMFDADKTRMIGEKKAVTMLSRFHHGQRDTTLRRTDRIALLVSARQCADAR